MAQLTQGSLFDGIGGFLLGSEQYGIETKWSSEIDAHCIELTKARNPKVQQHGDITKIRGKQVEPVDIICFGSPCNNLSLAGDKQGLKGEHSKLFYEAIRIIQEMREATNGEYPKYAIWENVGGALSSNKGQDFRSVLEAITKSTIPVPKSERWSKAGMVRGNEYSVAWRMFEAQYWGIPQSRERIFLVADFRGQGAGEILFECESLRGNKEKNEGNGEDTARGTATRTGLKYRTTGQGKQVASTIFASYGTKWNGNNGAYTGSHFVVEETGKLRRFTPLECERLMGFPDGWTVGFKDTVRYRMLGNSVPIPCVKYIYKNLVEQCYKEERGAKEWKNK